MKSCRSTVRVPVYSLSDKEKMFGEHLDILLSPSSDPPRITYGDAQRVCVYDCGTAFMYKRIQHEEAITFGSSVDAPQILFHFQARIIELHLVVE